MTHAPFVPHPSLCRWPQGSAALVHKDASHNERALVTAVRRFPYLLKICRDAGLDSDVAISAIAARVSVIGAEYRRVLRHP